MKKLLKKILLRVFGEWVTNKLRTVWKYWNIIHKLYLRNSAPVFVNTNHPVLTISSDDWGSIFLKNNGVGESAAEIKALAEVLSQNTDVRGRPAVLNAYITTRLPDFDSIAASEFREYFFYPTYRDHPEVTKAWLDGCKSSVFQLGFHGRDHFNYGAWLDHLRSNNEYFVEGFHERKVRYREGGEEMMKRMPELRYFAREYIDGVTFPSTPISSSKQNQIIMDGITTFKDIFGFRPAVFTAPGYSFDRATELAASKNQMFYIEAALRHTAGVDSDGHLIPGRLRWGEKLAGGVTVLIGNAHYEPDWRESGWGESNEESVRANQKMALTEIKRAFRRREPCILSTPIFTQLIAPHF